MKRRLLKIFESTIIKDAQGNPDIKLAEFGARPYQIKSKGVDESLAEAKAHVVKTGKKLRSMNVGTDGNIYAVVWKDPPPANLANALSKSISHWRFRRKN
jgi:hypothetical protein